MSIPKNAPASVRIDAWLWSIRAYKTRSMATAACRAGHVKLNDANAKAAQTVVPGDTIRVRQPGYDRILEVRRLINKRVGAEAASHCFTDHTPRAPSCPRSASRSVTAAPAGPPKRTGGTWTSCAAKTDEAQLGGLRRVEHHNDPAVTLTAKAPALRRTDGRNASRQALALAAVEGNHSVCGDCTIPNTRCGGPSRVAFEKL